MKRTENSLFYAEWRGHKNPSKFYKFMIGELSGARGISCGCRQLILTNQEELSADTVSCSLNGVTMNLACGDNRDRGWRILDWWAHWMSWLVWSIFVKCCELRKIYYCRKFHSLTRHINFHQSLYLFSHSHTSFKSPNSLEYPPLSLVSVYLHKYLWLFCDWPSLLHHIPTCSGPAVLLQFHETGHFMIERKVTQNVFLAPHPTHSRPSNLDKGLQPRARNFNENVLMSFVSIDSFKVYPVLISRLLRSINQQITFYN